jgi:hypothetical protein
MGLEYGYGSRELIVLRGAYRFNYDIGELSVGAGLNLPLAGTETRLDYSFSNYDVMGDVHRFGFTFGF